MLQKGTCAVSRYKLSRSQIFITVQDYNCEQMCVSGYMTHYKFVLGAGANKNRDKLIKHTVDVSDCIFNMTTSKSSYPFQFSLQYLWITF